MENKYKFQTLDEEEDKIVRKHFKGDGAHSNLVKVLDSNNDYLLTVNETFKEISHLYYDFKLREDDIWIITTPKVCNHLDTRNNLAYHEQCSTG
jgi:hypothetical protein